MKKLLLSAALVAAFGFAVNAQTDEGGWVVGGSSNLSFSSTSIDGADDNLNVFNIETRAGYFLMDNLAAGLNIGFSSTKQGDSEFKQSAIGPWARYYFNGTFYGGLGIDFTSVDAGGGSVSGNLIKLEAGYPIFIGGGETVAIEPALNYWLGGGDANDGQNTFALSVGIFAYF